MGKCLSTPTQIPSIYIYGQGPSIYSAERNLNIAKNKYPGGTFSTSKVVENNDKSVILRCEMYTC